MPTLTTSPTLMQYVEFPSYYDVSQLQDRVISYESLMVAVRKLRESYHMNTGWEHYVIKCTTSKSKINMRK